MESVGFLGSVTFRPKHMFKFIPEAAKQGLQGGSFSPSLHGKEKAPGSVPEDIRALCSITLV